MTGIGLTLQISQRPELSLQQQQRLELNQQLVLTQRMSLELYFELQDFFNGLYDGAKKKTYDKHGMQFEYAVVKKKDLPKRMLDCGPGFTVFRCDSEGNVDGAMLFVVEDYLSYTHPPFLEIVAVHEYGEGLMLGHREASVLEWGVAKREGFLKDYLNWVEANFPSKIADMEQISMLYDVMPEEVYESAKEFAKNSEEAKKALEIMRDFGFPEEARKLVEGYDRVRETVLSTISHLSNDADVLIKDSNLSFFQGGFLAAYIFRYMAKEALKRNMDKVASSSEQIERAWSEAISRVNHSYSDEASQKAANFGSVLSERDDLTEGQEERVKEHTEFFSRPFIDMLPERFRFAVEIEKTLKEDAGEEFRSPDEILKAKLGKALKVAKGLLKITELARDGEEEGVKKARERDTDLLRFYVRVLLFEAAREIVEDWPEADITDKKLNSMFAKKVLQIEEAFQNFTSKKLFISSEVLVWRDLSYLESTFKRVFVQKVQPGDDVKKFVGPDENVVRLKRIRTAAA